MSEWINVKDRLPEWYALLYMPKSEMILIGRYGLDINRELVWRGNFGQVSKDVISHWMPLPNEPEQKEIESACNHVWQLIPQQNLSSGKPYLPTHRCSNCHKLKAQLTQRDGESDE